MLQGHFHMKGKACNLEHTYKYTRGKYMDAHFGFDLTAQLLFYPLFETVWEHFFPPWDLQILHEGVFMYVLCLKL